jgi:serine phosphatase RsbU (regulator of sigma subunit)
VSDDFEGAEALREIYRSVDWSARALGEPSEWHPSLLATLDLALHTRFPITLFWGPEFTMLYNEAYIPLIADKHPRALGAPAHEVFPEIWDLIGPMLTSVMDGRAANWVEDAGMYLERRGLLEECFFTFSYSPIRDDQGVVRGVIDIATETTGKVLDRRRLALLSSLAAELSDVSDASDVNSRALGLLRTAREDLVAVDIVTDDAVPGSDRLPARPGSVLGDELLVEQTPHGQVAWMRLSGAHPQSRDNVLVALLSPQLVVDDPYREFLKLIAGSLGQAWDRVYTHEAERRVIRVEREMSEALQRSLLTQPLQPDHLEVAVRYQPAGQMARIGGDWYDSFLLPDGSLTLVIGDVGGHDRHAAAAMGQVRNLLRGVSFTLQKPPARVLSALDQTMHGLAVDVIATAIIAQIEQTEQDELAGVRTLRWSNAGHLPPVLLSPRGQASLLSTRPDVLLGVLPHAERSDHTVTLEVGSSVVFFTDGLIERRDEALEDSLERLRALLEGRAELSAEALCDYLLGHFGDATEDDVALLVLHAYAQTEPRPAIAGPEVLPADLRSETP